MQSTNARASAVPPPLIPVTPRGEATRRKLLTAAEEEFAISGFHPTSVSAITQRAGVGQGTFYLYFRSKEEVLAVLLNDIGHALRRQIAAAMMHCRSRLQAERAGLNSFLQFVEDHPGLYRIVQDAQFVDAAAYREYYQRIASSYVQGLKAASGDDPVDGADAELYAWTLMGIGHFLGMRYSLWDGARPDVATIDRVLAFVGNGGVAQACN